MRFHVLTAMLVVCAPGVASAKERSVVLVEAESFHERGGCVIDQQAIGQIGSPYLLAHCLGHPVEDAVTAVRLPRAGARHLRVRTWDWVSPWNAPGAPGRFQALLDGKPLPEKFGTGGAAWGWQDGHELRIVADSVEVALRDRKGVPIAELGAVE